jgi:hypothetical protein
MLVIWTVIQFIKICCDEKILFFFFGGTQDFTLVRQVLYHLSHSSSWKKYSWYHLIP